MSGPFVEVALNLPRVRGTFHYHVPAELGRLSPGQLIVVPFGRRRVQGVVIALSGEAPVPETRPVESLVDPLPVLTPAQLELARWMEAATLAPLGECTALMLPPGVARQADQEYRLLDPAFEPERETAARLVRLLREHGSLRGRQIERRLSRRDWRSAIESLRRQGVVESVPILDEPRRPRRLRTARLALPIEQALSADLGRGHAAQRRRRALETLSAETRPLDVGWLYAEAGARPDDLRHLERHGLITFDSREVLRDPLAGAQVDHDPPPSLTPDQARAWEPIAAALRQGVFASFLLQGVTGSGKTELYLRAVAEVLARGAGAIVLVPEIALTPQVASRFLRRFHGRVGLLHSGLSSGERYDTWRRARAGDLGVVVGPRSALFAPLPRIGLIVLDEEHDDSYKEQEGPVRYHARQAAQAYARNLQAVCLLGSATPDIVTSFQARSGELRRLDLPQRVVTRRSAPAEAVERSPAGIPGAPTAVAAGMPPVHVVDMRDELRAGNASLFSRRLEAALGETLRSGQQAILFLNRRGSATHVFCRDCGWVARCPRCDAPLTHHPSAEALRCHRCGYSRRSPRSCPQCGGLRVRFFGAGTQRVQQDVEARYPGVRTLRWDWDVTRRKGAHEAILGHFAAHRADVLIGTQMLAKGLDLPLVTLVGVISADTGLHLPDYRASERVFQLLTQVSGRAGRGPAGGQVVLQTYHPEHPAVSAAARHDYEAFYQAELEDRRRLGYPPFRRLVRLVFLAASPETAESEARRLASRLRSLLRGGTEVDLLGPTPCFYSRLRGRSRWQILLRGADPKSVVPNDLPEGWAVDVDPVSLL